MSIVKRVAKEIIKELFKEELALGEKNQKEIERLELELKEEQAKTDKFKEIVKKVCYILEDRIEEVREIISE